MTKRCHQVQELGLQAAQDNHLYLKIQVLQIYSMNYLSIVPAEGLTAILWPRVLREIEPDILEV